MYTVTISSKGTITIPAAVRKSLGLKTGQKVLQSMKGKNILLEFSDKPKDSK